MLDEIQAGFGRTGKTFCYKHDGIEPDVLIVGKSISNGFYPVSAVLADKSIMGVFKPGDHGSTYGGNPLGCAVARASLQFMKEENLCKKTEKLGNYLMDRLKKIKSPHIKEVRGKGLFIGVELNVPARPFCEKLMDEGILCKETHTYIIRITPPLVVTKEEIDFIYNCVEKVIESK